MFLLPRLARPVVSRTEIAFEANTATRSSQTNSWIWLSSQVSQTEMLESPVANVVPPRPSVREVGIATEFNVPATCDGSLVSHGEMHATFESFKANCHATCMAQLQEHTQSWLQKFEALTAMYDAVVAERDALRASVHAQ